MARISIYIPDDLKESMDAVGDAINWSEVARPAFQSAVANHHHRREGTMETAIERLRASKQEATQEDVTAGREDGRAWARDYAEYPWLVRLAQMDFDGNYEGAINVLKHALSPHDEMTLDEVLEYCFGDEKPDSDEYVGGFIEGAQAFFEEIKDQI